MQIENLLPLSGVSNSLLEKAEKQAKLYKHRSLDGIHVLHAILAQNNALTKILTNHGVSLSYVEKILQIVEIKFSGENVQPILWTPMLTKSLTYANNYARSLGCSAIQAKHLLYGICVEPKKVTTIILTHFVPLSVFIEDIMAYAGKPKSFVNQVTIDVIQSTAVVLARKEN